MVAKITGWSEVTADLDLGGLSSIQAAQISQELGLTPAQVTKCHNIRELSGLLLENVEDEGKEGVGADEGDEEPFRVFFTVGQIGNFCRWVIKFSDDAARSLDPVRLEWACNELLKRHPMLRLEVLDPKSLQSFMYDTGAVLLSLRNRFCSSGGAGGWVRKVWDFLSEQVYQSWLRVNVPKKHDKLR